MARETPVYAAEFTCAGGVEAYGELVQAGVAAKAAQRNIDGTRRAVLLFARFRVEAPGEMAAAAPDWSVGFFDPELRGSFSHFYETARPSAPRA